MAEFTATSFGNSPKRVHAGVNAIAVKFDFAANSVSVADIVLLAKIPHGARIVDFWEDHSGPAASCAVSFGLKTGGPGGTATYSLLIASGTVTGALSKNRMSVMGIPPLVSVSDASGDRFGILTAKIESVGTAMIGLVINCMCLYVTDGVT